MAERLCEFWEHPAGQTRSLTVTSSIAICSECIVLCQGVLADRSPRPTFVKELGKLAALTAQEEADVAKRIERGDLSAKMKMVESNLRLVFSVAGHYRDQELPFLNICQEGVLGLVRATETFDFRNGVGFSTYATPWVRRSIEHALDAQRS
ncbi:MAG: sigma factor [Solirubrobacteraceae bacterium]|nr:sigma factor [Solirubrobacteraceae bacterium]